MCNTQRVLLHRFLLRRLRVRSERVSDDHSGDSSQEYVHNKNLDECCHRHCLLHCHLIEGGQLQCDFCGRPGFFAQEILTHETTHAGREGGSGGHSTCDIQTTGALVSPHAFDSETHRVSDRCATEKA